MTKQLAFIHQQLHGITDATKYKLPIILAAFLAPMVGIFEKYIFDEWEFLGFIITIVVIDTATGLWKAVILKRANSTDFGGFIIKVVVYGLFLAVIHIIVAFPKSAVAKDIFAWVDDLGYSALIVRESISIIENLGVIRPNLIPSWILRRLKEYDEKGNFKNENSSDGSGQN